MDYCINTGVTDAEAFCEAVDFALIRGFLLSGDVLIVDNATLHKLPDSESRKKHMLSHHGVILLGLPLGSPDLNPMKLLMDTLAHRLRQRLIVEPTSLQESHRVVHAITEILGAISHREIALYYKRQSYLLSRKPRRAADVAYGILHVGRSKQQNQKQLYHVCLLETQFCLDLVDAP